MSQYLVLNPDDVKEEMARRGMVPEVEGLAPLEGVALIHEESSHITNMLAAKAYADQTNVMWDITMAGRGSVERRLDELEATATTAPKRCSLRSPSKRPSPAPSTGTA